METRINKYLSEIGFCSRREADKLLEKGRITINGKIPELGTKVKTGDTVAVDGEQGVEMASSEKPDLILMDLSLPKMDGWTATKHIKSSDDLKSIPIIALSAHAMEEHKKRALDSGCNDYDTKPVDIDRLLSKISAQLGTKND